MKKAFLFCVGCLLAVVSAGAQEPSTASDSAQLSNNLITEADLMQLSAAPLFQKKGIDKYRRWVLSVVEYPAEMDARKIGGTVQLQVIVESDGSVSVGRVIQSPHQDLTDVVVRVVEQSPKWTPGRMFDKAGGQEVPVRVAYLLSVDFKVRMDTKDPYGYRWRSQDEVRPYGSN